MFNSYVKLQEGKLGNLEQNAIGVIFVGFFTIVITHNT